LFFLLLILTSNSFAQTSLKGFGDSNTEYWIDLAKEKKFLYLLGTEEKLPTENFGRAGATLEDFAQARLNANLGLKGYVTIMFGTNDAANKPETVNGLWKKAYKDYIQQSFLNNGYDKSKIILISPNYTPDHGQSANYLPALEKIHTFTTQIANELGIKYVDLYATLKYKIEEAPDKLPGSTWVDGLHLTERGHRLLADMVENAIGLQETPLPIKLSSVVFKKVDATTYEVSFTASQTTGTKEFVIYYSKDGINFIPLHTVKALKLEADTHYNNIRFKVK
jgi:lysophospholipase L1-like esterase